MCNLVISSLSKNCNVVGIKRSCHSSSVSVHLRRHGDAVPFKPSLDVFYVITHRTRAPFVNNLSIANDMKADRESTIPNVSCVKHCVNNHWTSGNFLGQFSSGNASFGLGSVRSDDVVVLKKKKAELC